MKLINTLQVMVLVCALIYLVFAFGQWAWSPGEWPAPTRALCSFLMSIGIGATGGIRHGA